MTAVSWRQRAACRGVDSNLFFPDRGESTTETQVVCAGCEVRNECLAHALVFERMGIWGGTTERQRRRRRARQRQLDEAAA